MMSESLSEDQIISIHYYHLSVKKNLKLFFNFCAKAEAEKKIASAI